MIDATNAIGSLISAIFGAQAGSGGAVLQGGFGPDAIVELGRRTFGNVPGYNILANLNSATTKMLQFKAGQALQPVPILSQKQVDEINATVTAAAEAIESGDFAAAKTHARSLLQRDFNDPLGSLILGRISMAQDDLEGAAAHFGRASSLAPGNQRIANDFFNATQLLRGENKSLETAAQLVGNRDTALRGVGLLFELAKRSPQQGRIYAHIAEGFDSLDLPVQQLGALGVVLEEGTQDDLEELEGKLRKFINDNPPVGLAYSVLGRTQQKLGKFSEAAQSLKTAIGIAPEVLQYSAELANVHATIGNIALGKGQLKVAEYRFKEARTLDPLNSDLKFGLGAVFISQAKEKIKYGLDNSARALLGRAKSLLGSDKSLNNEIASAYMQLGQRALADNLDGLALVNFESAFERNPNLGGLKRLMADIHRADGQQILDGTPFADMSTSQFEQAVKSFQKAFDLTPRSASDKSTLATVLNEFGLKLTNVNQDYDRAVEMLGRARELYPDNATYDANYAIALDLHIKNPSS